MYDGFIVFQTGERLVLDYKDLVPFQLRAISTFENMRGVALILKVGAGKTVISLTAINQMLCNLEISNALIVTTKFCALTVWLEEKEKWRHLEDLKGVKVLGTPKNKAKMLNTPAQIYVTNYENLTWLCQQKKRFDCVVFDEFTKMKHRSKRFKAFKKYNLDNTSHVKGLTGTPVPVDDVNIFNQVLLLDKGKALGTSITNFKDEYYNRSYSGYNWDLKPDKKEALQNAISPLFFTVKDEEYLSLPELQKVEHTIPLTKRLDLLYRSFEKSFLLALNSDTKIVANSAGVLWGKLLQFCNGAMYTDETRINYEVVHDLKMEYLEELLESLDNENVLIVYRFKSDCERIQQRIKGVEVIDKKGEAIKRWQQGKIKRLLIHPGSAGHGIELQKGGNQIIWFSPHTSAEIDTQVNGRLHRTGQKNNVVAHYLMVKNTVEDKNYFGKLVTRLGLQKDFVANVLK